MEGETQAGGRTGSGMLGMRSGAARVLGLDLLERQARTAERLPPLTATEARRALAPKADLSGALAKAELVGRSPRRRASG